MIRRVRRQFIAITMAMLTTVLMVPLVALNTITAAMSYNQTRNLLEQIAISETETWKNTPGGPLTCPRMIFPRAAQQHLHKPQCPVFPLLWKLRRLQRIPLLIPLLRKKQVPSPELKRLSPLPLLR